MPSPRGCWDAPKPPPCIHCPVQVARPSNPTLPMAAVPMPVPLIRMPRGECVELAAINGCTANQKAAPSPFLDCRLLKRLRFTFVSSKLAWLLLS